ncbi:two pore domain potassium channel family protein [Aestuariibacter halophilus]|uniref:Two pore domain potassium channel family protein n=1 Tax=Fluctibacter halophilus TaxID=226011 RepID=A0ABS8G4H8_9ALTE|nr:potassium channel family protein [Aestuariibacter halophilus]MCC2615041.1 two pore domain potassium channel family protein [Aestuariibacter halophilus]
MNLDFVTTFLKIFTTGLWLTMPLWLPMILIILAMGVWIATRENWRISDGLYFAMITATTVGYGDMRPHKKMCKLIAILIALQGLLLTGIVVAIGLRAATISFEQHNDIAAIQCRLNPERCTDGHSEIQHE